MLILYLLNNTPKQWILAAKIYLNGVYAKRNNMLKNICINLLAVKNVDILS